MDKAESAAALAFEKDCALCEIQFGIAGGALNGLEIQAHLRI